MMEDEKKKDYTRKIITIVFAIFFWFVVIHDSIYPPADFYGKYHDVRLLALYIAYFGALFASFFAIFWDYIYHR